MSNYTNFKIETERLLLIPVSSEYRNEIFKEFSSEITTYMFPAAAKDISDTDTYIQSSIEELKECSNINITILDKSSKEFIGGGGLHSIQSNTPEFGIWIKKSAHGNKFGREAVTALKKWADENLSDKQYYMYPVDKNNIGSKKIAESLGGVVGKEYKVKNMSGNMLDEVEYHIPVAK